jgi:hypothetical protein
MKKFIEFFKINVAALLVVFSMVCYINIGLGDSHGRFDYLESIIYSLSLFLLLIQFLIWKKHKMLSQNLVSFFLALLIGNISMLLLALNSFFDYSNSLSFVVGVGAIATISIAITFLKLLTWLIFFIVKFSKNQLHPKK